MKIKASIVTGLIFLLLASAYTVSAEYYQYMDKNGNLCFTDNKAEIPEDQLKDAERYHSYQSENPVRESVQRHDRTKRSTSPSQDAWDAKLSEAVQRLEADHERLAREYERIKKAREKLQTMSPEDMTQKEKKSYNDKVSSLKSRIEQYRHDFAEYKTKLDQFNKEFQ